MAKDCPFYEVPGKCKTCDFAPKCLLLRTLAEIGEFAKTMKGGLGGLLGFGKNKMPKIKMPEKEP